MPAQTGHGIASSGSVPCRPAGAGFHHHVGRPGPHLRRALGAVRPAGAGAGGAGRQAGRPGGGADRKKPGGDRALSRRVAGRRDLAAAQPRLYPGGTGLFHLGRRAGAVRGGAGAGRDGRRRADRQPGNRWRERQLARAGGKPARDLRECRARARRSRRHSLHLRHHRPVQGRDAQPRESGIQRADPEADLAVHRSRRAAARAAHLSHPWAVRGHQHHPDGGRGDAVPAQIGCGRGLPSVAASHRDDGGADFLYPAAGRSAARPKKRPSICACSSPARRRCWRRPTATGGRAPATPSWNAMA